MNDGQTDDEREIIDVKKEIINVKKEDGGMIKCDFVFGQRRKALSFYNSVLGKAD